MNVKELIQMLEKMNPESPVVITAEDSGYHEVGQVVKVDLAMNAQEDDGYNGPHVDYDKELTPKSIRRRGVRLLPKGHR